MSENPYFKNLFSPIKIGGVTYKNRVAATPLGNVSVRGDGSFPQSAFALYERKARGGCAEVAASETPVDFEYANRIALPYVDYRDYSSMHIQGLKKYTEMLHSYGAVATIELNHCGAQRFASAGGKKPIGPSAFMHPNGLAVTEMDESLMDQTVENFAQAAYYMKQAGYDGVLPHMASGWLLQQFFSPLTNRREDEYGGTLENRARFPLRVLKAIRNRCGPDFLIIPRLSAAENVPGGYGIEDSAALCRLMEGLADMIHVVCGVYYEPVRSGEFTSLYDPHNANAGYAAKIKEGCRIPVLVTGGINDPAQADALIAEGKADLIGLGRQMLADPDWARKAESGQAEDIAKCIRCYRCFPGPLEDNGGAPLVPPDKKCSVNPQSDLSELDPPLDRWPEPKSAKRVLIVGGGIAGLTAAYTAARRGHSVMLAEKSSQLGGLIRHADVDLHKSDMSGFKKLSIRRCEQAGISILLNTEITAGNISDYKPDAVVIAVGAAPVTPHIPGIEKAHQALQAYFEPEILGESVVMAGGGLVGCECALNMARQGHKVTLIEMRDELAPDDYKMHRVALLEVLKPMVAVRTGLKCVSFEDNGVQCEDMDGNPVFLKADTVVYAMGLRANSALADELEAALGGRAPVYRAGDCIRAAKIQNAVEEGFLSAMKIV